MRSTDVIIAGAGLIGMACALECRRRGLQPTLVERGAPGTEASWAAAGMLAANDPANPRELQPLADLSLRLYPEFLERLREQSGHAVPIETEWTVERGTPTLANDLHSAIPAFHPEGFHADGYHAIREQSLDPRKLSAALHAAVLAAEIPLRTQTPVLARSEERDHVVVQTESGPLQAAFFLDCTGAWSSQRVRPAKGQMLRVHAPGVLDGGDGNVVLRTHDIYLVPRLDGSVVIGATVEDAGFDKAVHGEDLDDLRRRAAVLIPVMAHAPALERWAGLRPDTPDHLPVLGRTGARTFVAAGHFRNGILLAPATAHVVAQLLLHETPGADLRAFDPARFSADNASAPVDDRTIFAQTW